MKCIFVIIPKECSFVRKGECSAVEAHVITCAHNHRRLYIREDMREVLINIFTEYVVDSPQRIKVVSGQDGRDILEH
ncbi:hypothetical protein LCGC14_1998320 [marine sediment metagenome]|uniref:Uncharacterized protein n=1 Tax=marine sediment metagenome TaxID=412755 RepID=A0A0F9FRT9_9ZZZZ